MKNKILVAYATKFGSTREVARKVADILKREGFSVDLRSVRQIKRLGSYDGIVFGTAIRMGRPLPEALRFIRNFKDELNQKPVACFSVGLYMKEDTEENRQKAKQCIAPILQHIQQPLRVGMFGGKVDYSTMPLLLRMLFSRDKSGTLQEGDWRDWRSIEHWAEEVARDLSQ